MHILLKEAGLYRGGEHPTAAVMAVPLFETIDDLERSARIMTELLGLPKSPIPASARIPGSDGRRYGFDKDGGYLTSVWSLARRRCWTGVRVLARRCRFPWPAAAPWVAAADSWFAAIRGQPARQNPGRIRITEQGEIIAANTAMREAIVNLESIAAATLSRRSRKCRCRGRTGRFAEAMDEISARRLCRAYRALVYGDSGYSVSFSGR